MQKPNFDLRMLESMRWHDPVAHNERLKDRERAAIAQQTAEYLSRGGEIQTFGSEANRCPTYLFNSYPGQQGGGVKS